MDLFAAKTWVPYNSVKIYEYDYKLASLRELYEIPLDADKL